MGQADRRVCSGLSDPGAALLTRRCPHDASAPVAVRLHSDDPWRARQRPPCLWGQKCRLRGSGGVGGSCCGDRCNLRVKATLRSITETVSANKEENAKASIRRRKGTKRRKKTSTRLHTNRGKHLLAAAALTQKQKEALSFSPTAAGRAHRSRESTGSLSTGGRAPDLRARFKLRSI